MFQEAIIARGDVIVRQRNVATGEVTILEDKKNLVVKAGKNLLARLLGGDVTATKIDGLAFGTNNTAPAVTDVGLGTQITKKTGANLTTTIGLLANSDYNQVKFSASLLSGEFNGQTYKELGLFSGTTLFSRIVIGDIVKSTAYEIDVEWTISFQ